MRTTSSFARSRGIREEDRRSTRCVQGQLSVRVCPIFAREDTAFLVPWLRALEPRKPLKGMGKGDFFEAMKPQPFAWTVM
jgi:hypothetical protein